MVIRITHDYIQSCGG